MNAEEIRAEAIDRIARADFAIYVPYDWADAKPSVRNHHLEQAAKLVDALGDLLPTGLATRTIVYDPDPEETGYAELGSQGVGFTGEFAGLAEVYQDEGGRVGRQRRWTHEWQEVPE